MVNICQKGGVRTTLQPNSQKTSRGIDIEQDSWHQKLWHWQIQSSSGRNIPYWKEYKSWDGQSRSCWDLPGGACQGSWSNSLPGSRSQGSGSANRNVVFKVWVKSIGIWAPGCGASYTGMSRSIDSETDIGLYGNADNALCKICMVQGETRSWKEKAVLRYWL